MVSLRRKTKEAKFRERRKFFTGDVPEKGGISFSNVNVKRPLRNAPLTRSFVFPVPQAELGLASAVELITNPEGFSLPNLIEATQCI